MYDDTVTYNWGMFVLICELIDFTVLSHVHVLIT